MGKYNTSANDTAPFQDSETVVPGDTSANNFAKGVCRGLYVGGAGAITAVYANGTTQAFAGVPAGSILPGHFIRVNATGTAATGMVALY